MMADLEIKARLDTSELEEQEAEWRTRLRMLNTEVRQVKLELRRTSLYAITILGSIMSMANVFVSMLPEPIRLIGQAAVSAVFSVVTAITTVAAAYATGGPVTMVQAAIAIVGVGIAVLGLIQTIALQEKTNAEVAQFQQGMSALSNSMMGVMQALGR